MFTWLLKPGSEPGFPDLILRLTLLEILMRPMGFWAIRASLLLIAVLGLLVLVIGLAQCTPQQKFFQRMYFVVYLLVLLYSEVPWTQILWGMNG